MPACFIPGNAILHKGWIPTNFHPRRCAAYAAGSRTAQNDGYVALKGIARQNRSPKNIWRIVPMLNKSDILLASRGFQGGYRLAQSPDKYTVGMILRITEGSLAPVACLDHADPFCATAVQTASRCPCGRGPAAPSTNIPRQHHPAGYIESAAKRLSSTITAFDKKDTAFGL